MENLELGLLLMVVGMTTVFVILLIVIYLGKGLITLVNKYVPEELVVRKQAPVRPTMVSTEQASTTASSIIPHTVAIVSAISALTGGKGKVTRIEKN